MDSQDTRITYRAIQERAKQDALERMPEFPKLPDRQLYADSARGIYIPQHFAETVNRELCDTPDDDLDLLAKGPDTEHYWETWESVLNSCVLTDKDGQRWTLYQDGDLWLVPEGIFDAWEAFQSEVEDVDAHEIAHESSEWDWVIYYARAMELCQAVPSDVLSEAESDWVGLGGLDGSDPNNFGLFHLATELARLIVIAEIVNAIDEVKEELIDLAQTQMDNL